VNYADTSQTKEIFHDISDRKPKSDLCTVIHLSNQTSRATLNRSNHRLSVMVLVLFLVSELLTDGNTLIPDQILQAVALFSSSGDDPGLVLVLALRVHVVGLAVLVLASLLGAAVGRGGGHPLELYEQRLQAGNTADSDGDEVFDNRPNHEVGEAPDVVNGSKEAVKVEGANDCCGTCTVRFLLVQSSHIEFPT
jgi:hypothetical protein